MKHKALGKGLNALIPKIPIPESDRLERIPIGKIKPSPCQPRRRKNEKSLHDLTESIASQGVLMPILVRPSSSGYEIVAGERRWQAAKRAGIKHIPAVIKHVSDPEALEIALIENLQREDLNPIDIAQGYQQLIAHYGFTQEELAQKLGQGRPSISNMLRLLKLPEEVQQLIQSGKLSTGHAKVLLGVSSKRKLVSLAFRTIEKDWSVRTLEKQIRLLKKSASKTSTDISNDPFISSVVDYLKQRFSTNISLKMNNKGKGSISIEFYSQEDLSRIVELLKGGSLDFH